MGLVMIQKRFHVWKSQGQRLPSAHVDLHIVDLQKNIVFAIYAESSFLLWFTNQGCFYSSKYLPSVRLWANEMICDAANCSKKGILQHVFAYAANVCVCVHASSLCIRMDSSAAP